MKKPTYITKEDSETIRNANKIFKKIAVHLGKLNEVRRWSDLHKDEDKGGKRWCEATEELYETLDFIQKRIKYDVLNDIIVRTTNYIPPIVV